MNGGTRHGARRIRRAVQALSFGLFIWLLWWGTSLLPASLPADSFLRLDPLVSLVVPLAARAWIPTLMPGLLVLIMAVAVGRVFCGYVCPMGITLDVVNRLCVFFFGRRPPAAGTGFVPPRRLKYLLLAGILGSALLGFNLAFWAAPIPLVTRLYALLLQPLLTLAGHAGLEVGQPLLTALDTPTLSYMQIPVRRFDGLYFLLGFFGVLFWLERLHPRFWCRFVCPAGALLGVCSLRPLWRRRVQACTQCKQCARQCPVEAITADGIASESSECLACRACVDACPVSNVLFSVRPVQTGSGLQADNGKNFGIMPHVFPSRRAFLAATGSGIGLAAVELSGVFSVLNADGTAQGLVPPITSIRPPGAVPEAEFSARCTRCGQCMKACPTNGLQPVLRACSALH